MKKHVLILCVLMCLCSVLSGCMALPPAETLKEKDIDNDIRCEFRVGQNAAYADTIVDTDIVFDKDEFIKLYNEENSYDPIYLKNHLEKCDLRISIDTQPAEWDEMFNSEVNIKMLFEGDSRSVSVYRYGSKLYFFVLSMGGRRRPDDEGYYYMELSEDLAEYWQPILEKVCAGN